MTADEIFGLSERLVDGFACSFFQKAVLFQKLQYLSFCRLFPARCLKRRQSSAPD